MLHFHGDEVGKTLLGASVGKPVELDQSLFDQDHAKSVKPFQIIPNLTFFWFVVFTIGTAFKGTESC